MEKKRSSSSKKKPSLRDLSREMPSGDEFARLMDEVDLMDDRPAVLILSALIDNLLEVGISLCFVDLDDKQMDALFWGANAPISTFSSKIVVAHALGIFGNETRHQLNIVRSIRNAFAHAVLPITFDNPLVAAECSKLDPNVLCEGPYQADEGSTKERFLATCRLLASIIMSYSQRAATVNQIMGRRQPSPDKFVLQHLVHPGSQSKTE